MKLSAGAVFQEIAARAGRITDQMLLTIDEIGQEDIAGGALIERMREICAKAAELGAGQGLDVRVGYRLNPGDDVSTDWGNLEEVARRVSAETAKDFWSAHPDDPESNGIIASVLDDLETMVMLFAIVGFPLSALPQLLFPHPT